MLSEKKILNETNNHELVTWLIHYNCYWSRLKLARNKIDLAIGGDQGGSIRIPSSWCGVVGLKPTFGLVPYTGISSIETTFDHAGPMARTVKDCALLLEVYQLCQLLSCCV